MPAAEPGSYTMKEGINSLEQIMRMAACPNWHRREGAAGVMQLNIATLPEAVRQQFIDFWTQSGIGLKGREYSVSTRYRQEESDRTLVIEQAEENGPATIIMPTSLYNRMRLLTSYPTPEKERWEREHPAGEAPDPRRRSRPGRRRAEREEFEHLVPDAVRGALAQNEIAYAGAGDSGAALTAPLTPHVRKSGTAPDLPG